MGLNTILISDLEVVVERRACPCTEFEIMLKSRKDCMLVSVPVSVVRYQKCTGTPQPWGTGTSASLHVGTGTSEFGTGTTASATAPIHCSITRGLSRMVVINSDDLHLFSGIKPLQKLCSGLEKPAHA